MIKLIAIDLDGTLLDEEKKSQMRISVCWPKLKQKGSRSCYVQGAH